MFVGDSDVDSVGMRRAIDIGRDRQTTDDTRQGQTTMTMAAAATNTYKRGDRIEIIHAPGQTHIGNRLAEGEYEILESTNRDGVYMIRRMDDGRTGHADLAHAAMWDTVRKLND